MGSLVLRYVTEGYPLEICESNLRPVRSSRPLMGRGVESLSGVGFPTGV